MRKSLCVLFLAVICVFILTQCVNTTARSADVRGINYADANTCVKCHADIEKSYAHTAHFKTSAPATQTVLQQLYNASSDSFSFPNEKIKVEKKENGFYQTDCQNGNIINSRRFDLAFGARAKAQTFGYWQDGQVFQLPLSYFNAIPGWANSPGFPTHRANFNRVIISRCFECHASYIEKNMVQTGGLSVKEVFTPNSIVYGIDCQRCHGPAAAHVQFHTENPAEKTGKYITRWKELSRQQKLDACAVCHSGNDLDMQHSTFAFTPGDTLENFFIPSFGSASTVDDVHGKQMQLLAASECYKKSNTLECGSCHDPHLSEKNSIVLFSQKCMSCHQPSDEHFCKMSNIIGEAVKTNCIDCHMPLQASKLIMYQKAGQDTTTSYFLRTHRIAIYPK